MTRRLHTLFACLALGAAACGPAERADVATETTTLALATPEELAAGNAAFVYDVAAQGNEARYRVREQLAGFDFPNDAVGKTDGITGSIAFDANGRVVAAESKIVVDVTKLVSDKERRDGYVQRRTLVTDTFPTVVLVPTAVRGLTFALPAAGTRTVEVTGNLTVRGVTRPTTWRGPVTVANGQVKGQMTTSFTFADFGMEKPKVRSVLSVDDTIKLEYDLTFVPRSSD